MANARDTLTTHDLSAFLGHPGYEGFYLVLRAKLFATLKPASTTKVGRGVQEHWNRADIAPHFDMLWKLVKEYDAKQLETRQRTVAHARGVLAEKRKAQKQAAPVSAELPTDVSERTLTIVQEQLRTIDAYIKSLDSYITRVRASIGMVS